VGKLVSLRRCSVRDHIQELRRNRAIEDKVAIEELHFLDRLESPQTSSRSRSRRRRDFRLDKVFVFGGVLRVLVIWVLVLEDRVVVIVLFEVGRFIIVREVGQGVFFVHGRVVGLLVVCVVVGLGVYAVILRVIMRRVQRVSLFELFVVAVGVIYVLDGVLRVLSQWGRLQKFCCAYGHETHRRLWL
jgi:hypothetical protein